MSVIIDRLEMYMDVKHIVFSFTTSFFTICTLALIVLLKIQSEIFVGQCFPASGINSRV